MREQLPLNPRQHLIDHQRDQGDHEDDQVDVFAETTSLEDLNLIAEPPDFVGNLDRLGQHDVSERQAEHLAAGTKNRRGRQRHEHGQGHQIARLETRGRRLPKI